MPPQCCVHTYADEYACVWRPEDFLNHRCFCLFCLEIQSVSEPGAHRFGLIAWLVHFRHLPVSASPAKCLQMHTAPSAFLRRYRGSELWFMWKALYQLSHLSSWDSNVCEYKLNFHNKITLNFTTENQLMETFIAVYYSSKYNFVNSRGIFMGILACLDILVLWVTDLVLAEHLAVLGTMSWQHK